MRQLEGAGGCKSMTKDESIRVAQQMVLSSFLEEVVSGGQTWVLAHSIMVFGFSTSSRGGLSKFAPTFPRTSWLADTDASL